MRQRGGTQHQAEHQREKVVALRLGRHAVLARKGCGVLHDRLRPRQVRRLRVAPAAFRFLRIFRIRRQVAARGLDVDQRGIAEFQVLHPPLRFEPAVFPRLRQGVNPGVEGGGAGAEHVAHFDFLRVVGELGFTRAQFRQRRAVGHLRDRIAGVLHRQVHHRNHVGDDQDDVLRDLSPGHRAHAAEERAHQDARQAEEDADRKIHAGEARRDQSHAIDLRHDIRERHDHGRGHGDDAHQVAARARSCTPMLAIASGQEIGDGVLA